MSALHFLPLSPVKSVTIGRGRGLNLLDRSADRDLDVLPEMLVSTGVLLVVTSVKSGGAKIYVGSRLELGQSLPLVSLCVGKGEDVNDKRRYPLDMGDMDTELTRFPQTAASPVV